MELRMNACNSRISWPRRRKIGEFLAWMRSSLRDPEESVQPNETIPMRALLAGARRKEPALLKLTQALVRAESPSDNKVAVDACGALAAAHARELGGRVRVHRQRGFGDLLEIRFGWRRVRTLKPVLLLGHIDTVWPMSTLKSMPCRIKDCRLWGPGTLDMKVGIAMAF